MMGEKISVIVPVYNVEAYLEKCVESILKQTYTNLEILLVNDGSTDNSGELCDQLAQRDQRIRVIHKENGGLSDARNRGIEEASSDLIGFIDSDDYIDEDMYETLYRQMFESNADLSMCGHYDVYHQIPEKQVATIQTWELTPQEAIKMVMEAKILSVTAVNKLYRKELFEELRFEIGKIAEDAFIMIALIHELADTATMRLNWAYFYVLDRLLVDEQFHDKKLENLLIKFLKSNTKYILSTTLFTNARKVAFIFLLVNKKVYKMILKKRNSN